ncbi:SET domain-containing protein 3, partial [Linderina pennispora]
AAYKEDPKNYYDLLRTTRPHTHFHPEIDLCVDARRQGSEARFVRSSCTANAVLRSIHIADGAESQIHLGLFALRQIEPDEELTVAWKWEDGEMPAVARLSPSDAEDYLGRPEGRRMSKVWRQAFNGTSCGCADAQCVVRQLFAMLGVEESRADYGPEIKRRASRPPKAETDNPLSPLLAGSVRSPENGKSGRGGGHSRKTSDVGLDGVSADSPTSSAQRRQARSNNGYGFGNGSNADNVSGKASAEVLGEHYVGDGQRKSSADSNFRQSLDRPSDMEDIEDDEDEHERCGSELRGANGDDPMDSVPMEPSSSENGRAKGGEKRGRKRRAWQVNGEAAHSAGPGSLGISTHGKGNGKRRRTSSNNPSSSSSSPTCHMLPQKKIWMSQYIELASASASANGTAEAVGDIGGFVIEEPSPKKSPKPAAAKPAESSQTASSDTPVVAPPAQTTAKTEQDLSMNADAEPSTGKPDLSVSILGTDAAGATKPASQDSPASGSAAALSASPSSPSHAAGGPSGGVPQNKAEQTTSEEAASEQTDAPKSPADEEPSTGGGDDATSALAVPAPKKQRLSLEEYNKRRRVSHAQGTTNKEEPALSSSAPAASTAAGAAGAAGAVAGDAEVKSETSNDSGSVAVVKELPPPTKVKVSLEEYNRRRKLSGTASIDSNITAAAAPKDSTPADLSSVASSVAPPAAVPASSTLGKTDVALAGDAATKLSSGPGQTSPPTSADSVPSGVTIDTAGRRNSFSRTVRSPPPPPPISAPAATRPGDPQGRRGLLTPPPPIPHASSHPGSGRFDDRGPSTYSGGRKTNSGSQNEPYYRLERSAGGYYDDYDRERDRDGRDFRGRDRESYRDHDMKDRIRNRDFNTPPPPPPPMHGSMSASGPGFQGHGAYRQRDREFGRRDGSLERESGEISFGRGRSRSRDRGSRMGAMGDRDRRYGGPMGQGGGYYPSHNNNGSPPARSLTPQSSNSNSEWRSSGYAPPLLSPHHSAQAGGGSRGLSNSPPRRQQQAPDAPFASPHQQPLPGLSTTSGSPVAAGGGYRGINRRGGIGNNGGGSSRGDSPVRK